MKFKFNKVEPLAVQTKTNKTICVVDNTSGTYLNVAHKMSEFFSKTFYHSVNQNPFPRASMDQIGTGYDNIERVDEFWGRLDEFDIIMFPDLYFNDWGQHLRKMGKMVWGASQGEILETNRSKFKQELATSGLPTAKFKVVIGLNNLIKYLEPLENKWIKLSYYRGELETFKWVNKDYNKVQMAELQHKMGPIADELEFLVEDNIESIAEVGFDGWLIGGKSPNNIIWGLEVKDSCYIGKSDVFEALPNPLREINNKFGNTLQFYNYNGFYSTEVRVGKDLTPYFTDICSRAGSPPSNTYLEMVSNWDEIVIGGCLGKIVEPIYKSKYGVEIILKSQYCINNYLPVTIDKQYSSNIKLKSSFKRDGVDYIVPFIHAGYDMDAFGSVVCIGDNLEEIMSKALVIADCVKCYGLSYDTNALNSGRSELQRMEDSLKIKF